MRSLWSRWSILSIASDGSILSIGSTGSILSIGSIGSAGSLFSIGSAGSVGSAQSAGTIASVLSAGERNLVLGEKAHPSTGVDRGGGASRHGRRARGSAALKYACVGRSDQPGRFYDVAFLS